MQPAPTETAGTGAALNTDGTKASWTVIASIFLVQIRSESGALEAPR
jgi:hypothetical protein